MTTSGPETVVLLHSLGTDGGLWEEQVPALESAGYRVLTPDSSGHGANPADGPESVADWVDEIEAVTAAAGGPVHLAGLSMGGVQALAYALAHLGDVRSLTLANTFAQLDPQIAEAKIAGIRAAVEADGMTAYATAYLDETLTTSIDEGRRERLRASIAGVSATAYVAAAEVCFRAALAHRLPEVDVPTLVIAGADDHKTPFPLAQALHDGISGSRLVTVPDAGHLSCVEAPEAFAGALLGFLAEHRSAVAPGGPGR